MTYRVISLLQPWASLVELERKRYETRSWRTDYTGPLFIHASAAALPVAMIRKCHSDPFHSALTSHYPNHIALPKGQVIALVRLIRCHRVERVRDHLCDEELAFGDYGAGRWAWEMEFLHRLKDPIAAQGALGLWKWTPASLPAHVATLARDAVTVPVQQSLF